MGRFMRKVVRRIETIVAWVIAVLVILLMGSGLLWLLSVV